MEDRGGTIIVRRTVWGLFAAVIATLGACGPASEGAPDPEAEKIELQASYQRARLALTREGQGCAGHILRDQELQNAVAGKDIEPKPPVPVVAYDAPNPNRTYLANGEYRLNGSFGEIVIGRYWIDGAELCYENHYGNGCSRLIRGPNGALNEEVLDDRDPKALRLACTRIQLHELPARPATG